MSWSPFPTSALGRRLHLVLWAALSAATSATPLGAQSGSSPIAGATLRGWEERARLAIFDRGGSFHGRTSDLGILQRFNEDMDSEYDLDLISSTFSLSEDYEWYRRETGARFWAGSINHLRLIQAADLKASVGLSASWAADVWFRHDETLRTQRNLLWLGFRKKLFHQHAHAFLRGTLTAEKPEADLELGFVWSTRRGEVTVAAGALDLFSDLIYQGLRVDPSIADSALDYTSHPLTVRAALDAPLGRRFRAEGYALALTPTTVVVESQTVPDEGFKQDERYAYTGGLLEWAPSRRTALGVAGTWVRARIDRESLPAGAPEDDFDLTERTWQVGVYAIHRFPTRLSTDAWLARVWRTEQRVRPDTTVAPNVDYEDRTWAGRASITYGATSGFRGTLGFDFTARWASGPTPVPTQESLHRDNFRLRVELGWGFGRRALFILGANYDLDDAGFDGAHGRFALFW
jgi:hypothetical protein